MKKRFIFISGQIRPITANLVENGLKKFTKSNSQKPVNIFILNDNGGDAYASLRIFQVIKNSHLNTNTVAIKLAYSGALVILQAGKKRFVTKGTNLAFHMAEDFVFQTKCLNAQMHMDAADRLLLIDAHQFLIFTERGQPISKILTLFRKNAKISAKKALELNLIDGILPKSKIPKI